MTKKTSHFPGILELRDYIESEAADVFLYDNFAVVEVKEGSTLSFNTGFSLLLKGLMILGSKPWIYISNRVNSYSVVPTDYKYLNKVPTLKGLAIVSSEKKIQDNARLEESFFIKPLIIAETLQEAYNWGKEILEKD